jgi:hypothetical protein
LRALRSAHAGMWAAILLKPVYPFGLPSQPYGVLTLLCVDFKSVAVHDRWRPAQNSRGVQIAILPSLLT